MKRLREMMKMKGLITTGALMTVFCVASVMAQDSAPGPDTPQAPVSGNPQAQQNAPVAPNPEGMPPPPLRDQNADRFGNDRGRFSSQQRQGSDPSAPSCDAGRREGPGMGFSGGSESNGPIDFGKLFEKLDANGDNVISRDEFAKWNPGRSLRGGAGMNSPNEGIGRDMRRGMRRDDMRGGFGGPENAGPMRNGPGDGKGRDMRGGFGGPENAGPMRNGPGDGNGRDMRGGFGGPENAGPMRNGPGDGKGRSMRGGFGGPENAGPMRNGPGDGNGRDMRGGFGGPGNSAPQNTEKAMSAPGNETPQAPEPLLPPPPPQSPLPPQQDR